MDSFFADLAMNNAISTFLFYLKTLKKADQKKWAAAIKKVRDACIAIVGAD